MHARLACRGTPCAARGACRAANAMGSADRDGARAGEEGPRTDRRGHADGGRGALGWPRAALWLRRSDLGESSGRWHSRDSRQCGSSAERAPSDGSIRVNARARCREGGGRGFDSRSRCGLTSHLDRLATGVRSPAAHRTVGGPGFALPGYRGGHGCTQCAFQGGNAASVAAESLPGVRRYAGRQEGAALALAHRMVPGLRMGAQPSRSAPLTEPYPACGMAGYATTGPSPRR